MTIHLHCNRDLLEADIRAHCVSVTLSVDDLVACLSHRSGIDAWRCEHLIARKIQEAADIALARTLGVAP